MAHTRLSNFLAVVEIRTKLVSVSTLALATSYVSWRKAFPDLFLFILMWTATLAVDMGTTAFNNYFDYLRGTDNYRDINEPDKVLIHSGVEPAFAFWSAFWCFVAAITLGFAIAFTGRWWVLPAGLACMTVGFLYTGGPFPISRTPFGELFAGGCLGLALFAIACGVWSVSIDAAVLVAGLPSMFLVAAILTVNNTCDIQGDKAAGRKTFSVVVGEKGGESLVLILVVLSILATLLASFAGILPRSVFFTAFLGSFILLRFCWEMHHDGFSHATKGKNMKRILFCLVFFTISVVIGYVLQ
jgi:1,4-dihydroxy-2-naphthoate polyprenyltransferase